jgi:membrane glycosyltransferase
MAASAYAVSLPLLLWMMPVIVGLLLAIPIALVTSRLVSRPVLFRTPEQADPPPVLARANELAKAANAAEACPLITLSADPDLREAHLSNLPDARPRSRGQVDPHLAIARAKIEDAACVEEASAFLTPREKFAVLGEPNVLLPLLSLPSKAPAGMPPAPIECQITTTLVPTPTRP